MSKTDVEMTAGGSDRSLRWAAAAGLAITVFIGVASFVLSYAALYDLAAHSRVPQRWVWLWPLLVDAPIVQATIALVVLAKANAAARQKLYFWTILAVAAGVSVVANAAHAWLPAEAVLDPLAAAAVETVPPIGLLAATHGCLLLVRHTAAALRTVSQATSASGTADEPMARRDARGDECDTVEFDLPILAGQETIQADISAPVGNDTEMALFEPHSASETPGSRRRTSVWIDEETDAQMAAALRETDIAVLAEELKVSGRLRMDSDQIIEVLQTWCADPTKSQRSIGRVAQVAHTTVPRVLAAAAEHMSAVCEDAA